LANVQQPQPSDYSILYCPSNQDLNTISNWCAQTETYNNYGTMRILGYCYYGSAGTWTPSGIVGYDFGFSNTYNYELNTGNMPQNAATLPIWQTIFPQKQGDHPQWEVMWTDDMQSRQTTAGGPYFFYNDVSNHITGAYEVNGNIPTGNGGTNVAFRDGHVEWQGQRDLAHQGMSYITWNLAGLNHQYNIPRGVPQ